MNSHAHVVADPTSDFASESDVPSVSAVADVLRDVLGAYLTTDQAVDAIRHVAVCGDRVAVHLGVTVSGAVELAELEATVAARIRDLGVTAVDVLIRRPDATRGLSGKHGWRNPWADRVRLASVRHVVAVGAGKGGVGKSTVAVNLALALARDGLRVGLLDADIYGPSLPLLLGIEDGAARARMTPEKHIVPLEAHGIPLVSFGFFLGERSPAIWRGPMVAKAVKQFARGVAWPELDILIVDLPPGTGDVPLSLAQTIELSGAVIVTQPARVATTEAIKAARMFSALEVRVLGIVENMTGPFGAGAGESVSRELEVPFLGALPFDATMVLEGDAGIPTVVARPKGPTAARFELVAQRIAEQLGWMRLEPVGPDTMREMHPLTDSPVPASHDSVRGAPATNPE
ncbi:MAG: Mrp/NBP35 family ATP-binding protein [Gemmatimonadaceae bacterium]